MTQAELERRIGDQLYMMGHWMHHLGRRPGSVLMQEAAKHLADDAAFYVRTFSTGYYAPLLRLLFPVSETAVERAVAQYAGTEDEKQPGPHTMTVVEQGRVTVPMDKVPEGHRKFASYTGEFTPEGRELVCVELGKGLRWDDTNKRMLVDKLEELDEISETLQRNADEQLARFTSSPKLRRKEDSWPNPDLPGIPPKAREALWHAINGRAYQWEADANHYRWRGTLVHWQAVGHLRYDSGPYTTQAECVAACTLGTGSLSHGQEV